MAENAQVKIYRLINHESEFVGAANGIEIRPPSGFGLYDWSPVHMVQAGAGWSFAILWEGTPK